MVSLKFLEPYIGEIDTFFAYRTARTVAIRDRRLGLSLLFLQLSIAGYVIIYQIILQQSYLAPSDLVGSVRLQMLAPSSEYRWDNGKAPYCTGVTTLDGPRATDYTILDGTYAYTPNGNVNGANFFPQRACTFYDETSALPLTETDRVFLTTEERTTVQSVNTSSCSAAAAVSLSSPSCVFIPPYSKSDPNVTQRAFVADVEFFTLLVDHNMNAPLAGLSFTSKQMAGRLLDASGKVIDACASYSIYGPDACPDFIAVGVSGYPDILSIRTLMQAAGVTTLDLPSGTDDDDAEQFTSSREAGIVLVLDISYSNFYLGGGSSAALGSGSLSTSKVSYTYKVSTVPNTEYKFVTGVSPYFNESARILYNRHGVRIIVTTSGKVGYFNFMLALLNLSVSFSLFAVATYIMDFALVTCCPLRSLYRSYKERSTVDVTELRKAIRTQPAAMAELEAMLANDPMAFEPTPLALTKVLSRSGDVEDMGTPLLAAENRR